MTDSDYVRHGLQALKSGVAIVDAESWSILFENAKFFDWFAPSGEADGVIGKAQGSAYGNALYWRYDFDLKVGDSSWSVTFDDWLFLMEDGIVINRAEVTKFGIQIGEVTLVFRKPTTTQETSAKNTTAPIARN